MKESAFFCQCKALAGETSQAPWNKDDLFGFFQRFRPQGDGLESLFVSVPEGEAVLARLRNVYSATATPGTLRPEVEDAYFIVNCPVPAPPEELEASAMTMLENWREMAIDLKDSDLVSQLTPTPTVVIDKAATPPVDPRDTSSLDVWFYDLRSDWMRSLDRCPQANWMSEAFYSIGCDYALAAYITWPWYRAASRLADPFAPHFHLWRHGAVLRCRSRDDIVLYLGGSRDI